MLSGYAGTGKTTIMRHLLESKSDVTCATMTGKAMNVLKRKLGDLPGVQCRTIHNLLYKPISKFAQELIDERKQLAQELQTETRTTYQEKMLKRIHDIDTKLDRLDFARKEPGEESQGGLIVVDEASMLPNHVLADLADLGRPILLVGDDMQLEPVNGKSVLGELGVDARLTEVHRQALDNPILALATAIREGNAAEVRAWPKLNFSADMAARADKVLCYTNRTRHHINRKLREANGFTGMFPVVGDKLMCVYNVRGYSMINGGEAICERDFTTEETEYGIIGKGAVNYEGTVYPRDEDETLSFSLENFAAHYLDPRKVAADRAAMDQYTINKQEAGDTMRYFDYGYACTVHKAQGSEYEKVMIVDDAQWLAKKPGGMQQRQRWLYTAVTRAQDKLAWCQW